MVKIKLGPTGKFPHGKIHRSDEGELRIAIETRQGKVLVHLGSPVAWFGLEPDQAVELGDLLVKRGREAMA